jgi:hypothetical protein
MKAEYKAKWVAALRSGEYPQGYGQLKDDQGRFCCLGVLSDVVRDELNARWVKGVGLGDAEGYDIPGGELSCSTLPQNVKMLTDMPNSSGTFPSGYDTRPEWDAYSGREYTKGMYIGLTDLNDNEELTFDQIADVIEYFL